MTNVFNSTEPNSDWTTAIPLDHDPRVPNRCERRDERHDNEQDDELRAVLAAAAQHHRVVVLALVDGTRLNGTPLPNPASGSTLRLLEESGATPFVVRLAHVMYVRVLGTAHHR